MDSQRQVISTTDAPAALGPYSQAVRAGGFLFCSGQIGLDPDSGRLVDGSVADQTQQALENLAAVCRSAGTSLERAARITVYLARIEDFSAVNAVYERHFGDDPPARVTVGVAALPAGAEIALDAVVPLD